MNVLSVITFKRLSAALLAACIVQSAAVGGELAHWTFDEIRGNGTIPDQKGKADITITGGVPENLLRPGLYGDALFFNIGSSQFAIAPKDAPELLNDFTIRCVVQPYQVNSYRAILWKGDRKVRPQKANYYLGIRDGKVEFKNMDASGEWIVYSTKPIIREYEWAEISVHYVDGMVEIAVNGKLCDVSSTSSVQEGRKLIANDAPVVIGEGARSSGRAFPFYGLLDDLKISQGRDIVDDVTFRDDFEERVAGYEARKTAFEKRLVAAGTAREADVKSAYARLFKEKAKGGDAPFFTLALPPARRFNTNEDLIHAAATMETRIRLSAAGNEYEGTQLLVASNPAKNTKGIHVRISDFEDTKKNKLPASLATWGWIKRIQTAKPGIPVEFVGPIPDAIMEGDDAFDVAAGAFTSLLLRVHIPSGTPAGVYLGTVALCAGDFEEVIPVEIEVYGFSLPDKGALRVSFSFFEEYYREWFGLSELSDARKLDICQFLLRYRIPPSNIYSKEVYPELHILRQIKDKTNFFTVGGWPGVLPPAEAEKRVASYRATLKAAKEMGIEGSGYFYGVDELSMNLRGMASARQSHEYLSKELPGLRTMQTSFPIPQLRGLYNAWVPIMDSFVGPEEQQTLAEVKAENSEVWWYLADSPRHPLPNFFLDYPPFDCRIFSILSYKYKVDGVLYWAINREWKTNMEIKSQWPNAEWKPYIHDSSNGARKALNGMGNLIYPGRDGKIYPSLRLENLRDGLEDYEYLKKLEGLTTLVRERKGEIAPVKAAMQLLAIPENVASAANQYNPDPAALFQFRTKLARAIEELDALSKTDDGAKKP